MVRHATIPDDTVTPRLHPIFPIDVADIGPEATAAARERDAHLGTLVIGLFLGSVITACSILLGAWVIA